MAEPISIQQLKDASEDAITLADFIYKPENVMIPRRLAADINSLQYYLDYMSSYAQHSYETYDEMVANAVNLPENVSIFVTNDLDTSKNGIYTYNGTSFVKGEYQPENAAKDFVEAKLGGLEVFDGKVRAQDVSTADGSTQDVKNEEFRSELDALPFEGGVLADTFVTVTANGNYPATNLRDVVSNVRANTLATPLNTDLATMAEMPNYIGNLLAFKQGIYTTSLFGRVENANVYGAGSTINITPDNPVSVRIGSNSTVDGLNFKCLTPELPNSRSSMELTDGATYKNCSFSGFRDTVSNNAWGVYLSNTKNAKIINCKFSDNTTYDIILVDEVSNTLIDNVDSIDGTGCTLVIEPNGHLMNKLSVENTVVTNSNLDVFCVMNNASPWTMGEVALRNCNIGILRLWGGFVDLTNCTVENVEQYPRFMTGLRWDNLKVGENILDKVYPIQSGNIAGSTIVDFEGTPSWKFNTASDAYVQLRAFIMDDVPAGDYILTVDAVEVLDTSASVIPVFGVFIESTELRPALGLGNPEKGQTVRGKRSYIHKHLGGALRIDLGIGVYGVVGTAYLRGYSLNKILDINSDEGNFNDLVLSHAKEAPIAPVTKGSTSLRPTDARVGQVYFDTTLVPTTGKPITWNGNVWVDSLGAAV